MQRFYKIFRKKGCYETLEVLNSFQDVRVKQTNFLKALEKRHSYPNSFFRSKTDLIENNLISMDTDEKGEKVVILSERGKHLLEMIYDLEEFLTKKKSNI